MKNFLITFLFLIFATNNILFAEEITFYNKANAEKCAQGNCVNGQGTLTWTDGTKYEGEFKDEKMTGQGTFTHKEYKYVGEFKDDLLNGQGTFTFADGGKYVGEFKDDLLNGQGTLTYSNGRKYVGEFKDDLLNGQGTFTWPDGRKYVGEFKDDLLNGQGTFTYADGATYVGEWKDDSRNGQGTFTFAKGDKYVGEWKDDKKSGQGTLTYSNGDKYVGEFKDNLANGQGTYTSANGDIYVGEHKNGVQVKKILKGYKKFSYLEFDCSDGATAITQGVIKVYLFIALDRNMMRKYTTVNTSLESGEPVKKTIKITSWGENKISFELDHKIKHKFYAHKPYIKNDKYYQQEYKSAGGAWYSTDCTRVKER